MIGVNPATPYQNPQQLFDAMKAQPGKISVATAGMISGGHNAMELIAEATGVAPFFTRPICMAFASVTIFTMLLYIPAFKATVGRITGGVANGLRSLKPRRS